MDCFKIIVNCIYDTFYPQDIYVDKMVEDEDLLMLPMPYLKSECSEYEPFMIIDIDTDTDIEQI